MLSATPARAVLRRLRKALASIRWRAHVRGVSTFVFLLLSGCASTRATFEPSPFPSRAMTVQEKVFHTVRRGETLLSISKQYNLEVDDVRRANGLRRRAKLVVGQRLLMPVPPRIVEMAPPPGAPDGTTPDASVEEEVPPPDIAGLWLWPIDGNVSSKFGIRHRRGHAGIDVTAPTGTPVVASRDGVIRYAGRQGGYGQLVVVEHESGVTTWYAHLSRIGVKVDQKVHQGEQLGLSGATGNATGPHLHFEVRREGKPVDPLRLLP